MAEMIRLVFFTYLGAGSIFLFLYLIIEKPWRNYLNGK